nr:uncharacterized protein LOC131791747 [Pocillopora verrucosa]
MASTSGSEFVVNSAAETSQNVDLVFVDEDEMPLTSVAIGTAYLERESDEEIDSDFYQTDSEAEESDENEELQQAGPPRKRRRIAQGENDVVGDPVWVEDIRTHSDLPFTQPTGPKVRMGADQKDPGKDDDQPDLSMMDFRILVIRGLHGGRSYKIAPTAAAPQISRLNLSLGHFPVKVDKRCACKVHLQRVLTSYKCGLCGVHMCPSPCFEKYHTLQDYLYDDPEYGAATPLLKP